MKPKSVKISTVKRTTVRKKVLDAQEQLDSQNAALSQEEYCSKIAIKAYELFENRGCQHGHHLEDWLQAERLINEGADN